MGRGHSQQQASLLFGLRQSNRSDRAQERVKQAQQDAQLLSRSITLTWPHRCLADGDLTGLGLLAQTPAFTGKPGRDTPSGFLQYQLAIGPLDPEREDGPRRFVVLRSLTATRPTVLGRYLQLDQALAHIQRVWNEQVANPDWRSLSNVPLDRAQVWAEYQRQRTR